MPARRPSGCCPVPLAALRLRRRARASGLGFAAASPAAVAPPRFGSRRRARFAAVVRSCCHRTPLFGRAVAPRDRAASARNPSACIDVSRPPRALPAVAQVFQDQAHLGQEAEAEPPDPAVDPAAHGQHHPVRCGDGLATRRWLRRCAAALRSSCWQLGAKLLHCTLAFRPPAARLCGGHCALGFQHRNWPLWQPHSTHARRARAPQL